MSARAWLSGLGFLSILAAIAILAVLGARVLDDTDEIRTSPVDAARELDEAAGNGNGGEPSASDGGVVLPGSGAAGQAECETNRSTLELAAQAHLLTHGAPPADQQALVDAGFITETVDTHTVSVVDGEVVIDGTGACA